MEFDMDEENLDERTLTTKTYTVTGTCEVTFVTTVKIEIDEDEEMTQEELEQEILSQIDIDEENDYCFGTHTIAEVVDEDTEEHLSNLTGEQF